MCCESIKEHQKAKDIFIHEITHAMQGCKGTHADDCETRVCNEIQAYYNQMKRFITDAKTRENMVKSKAFDSLKGFTPCKDRSDSEISKMINDSYAKCATYNI